LKTIIKNTKNTKNNKNIKYKNVVIQHLVFVITIAFVHLAFCVQVECQIRIQLERHIRIRETHINLVKSLAHFIKQSSK
jgi:hypothetical protein